MKCLFLSHVEEDQDISLELASALFKTGYSVWCYEEDSLPGRSYLLNTQEAIDQCQAFLLLVSVHSMASHQIDRELEHAHELAKLIVPIRFDIKDKEYKEKKRLWTQIVGTTTSISITKETVNAVAARIAEGLRKREETPVLPKQEPPKDDPPEDHAVECPRCGETTDIETGTGTYICPSCDGEITLVLCCPGCGEELEVEEWGTYECSECGEEFDSWTCAEVVDDGETVLGAMRTDSTNFCANMSKIDNHHKIHAELLGEPLQEERTCPDGVGRYRHYEKGSIHYHPATGVRETHGAIRDVWARGNWENGWLGYPVTDEQELTKMELYPISDNGNTSNPNVGRISYFQNGAIFWLRESDKCGLRQRPQGDSHNYVRNWKSL